jgi:hypothetical protein
MHHPFAEGERAKVGNRNAMKTAERAISAHTYVTHHRGRWTVRMAVVFPDVITQHELLDYHCEKRARYAADVIERAANRW